LPADETAVFQDEVDINTNPKIGAMWMRRGQQAEVPTPGTNDKRYLAGSVNWRTGALFWTVGRQRNGELFCRHLDELRQRLRCYRVIHVICDNARFHVAAQSRQVRAYLERWGDRLQLHYLPTYAPETNPIERLWWHLHEEIGRCHNCQGIEELLEFTFAWLESRNPYAVEDSESQPTRAA
jgi:transposase